MIKIQSLVLIWRQGYWKPLQTESINVKAFDFTQIGPTFLIIRFA